MARGGERGRLPRLWRHLPLLVLLGVLGYLVLLPVATVIWGSFRDNGPGLPGGYTFDNYIHAYTERPFLRAVQNTFVFGTFAATVSFCVGSYLAYLTERTNVPGRQVIYAAVLVPLIVPTVLTSTSWILLLNPNIGILNHVAESLLGVDQPIFNVYSLVGMIWVEASHVITLPFLLMAVAFRSLDSSFEEAASAAGASSVRIFLTVTLPLVRPAGFATLLLLFIGAIETLEVPLMIGVPGSVPMFATQVFVAVRSFPVDYNIGAAFAGAYLVVAACGVLLYFWATRLSEKYATITGRGFRPTRHELGRVRFVHATIAFGLLGLNVLLPLLVMFYTSVVTYFQTPTIESFRHLTLTNYEWLLSDPGVLNGLRNSLMASVPSAVIAVTLAAVVSWVVVRTKIRGRRALDAIAFSPIAYPGTVLGLALIWLYLTIPVPVYGTIWIIVLGFVAKYIPYAIRATHAAITQVDAQLEEASAAAGASASRTFLRITVPLITAGLVVSVIYITSLTFKVLSIPVLLSSAGNEVLSVGAYNLYSQGEYTRLSALGVGMVVLLVAFSAAVRLLSRRFGYMVTE